MLVQTDDTYEPIAERSEHLIYNRQMKDNQGLHILAQQGDTALLDILDNLPRMGVNYPVVSRSTDGNELYLSWYQHNRQGVALENDVMDISDKGLPAPSALFITGDYSYGGSVRFGLHPYRLEDWNRVFAKLKLTYEHHGTPLYPLVYNRPLTSKQVTYW